MTREEYMRMMAMRAERQRAEYAEYYGEKIRREQERMAIKMFKEAQELAKEAEKPKKSAIALEAEKGNVIDAEFEEVKPQRSPSKLVPKGS